MKETEVVWKRKNMLEVSVRVFRIVVPLLMFIGIIGNTLNIIILKKILFRRKSFSFYLLIFSINNLIYCSLILCYRLLSIGYQISPSLSSNVLCKLFQYVNDLCPYVSPYLIVLASFDRYCYSSFNEQLQRFNQIKLAKCLTLILMIFLMLFCIPSAYLVELNVNDGSGCRLRTNAVVNQIYVIIQFVLLLLICPFLMILFLLMTKWNINKFGIIVMNEFEQRRIEMELIRMIFYQIVVHVILIIPMGVAYLMILLPTKYSLEKDFYGVYTICYLPFYFSYGTSFFFLLFFNRTYRKEFVRIIHKIRPFLS